MMLESKFKLKGHLSFVIKNSWITKGLNHVKYNDRIFWENDAHIQLGIGTTMIKSLRFYLNHLELIEELKEDNVTKAKLTELGELLLKEDPYIEDLFTIALLHYKMVNNSTYTIWNHLFNQEDDSSFTKESMYDSFVSTLKKIAGNKSFSKRSALDDIDMIIRSYVDNTRASHPENNQQSVFSELGLIEQSYSMSNQHLYRKTPMNTRQFDDSLFVYVILDQYSKNPYFDIETVMKSENNLGKVFNLSPAEVMKVLERLEISGWIKITVTADIRNFEFLQSPKGLEVLENYYSRR